MSGQSATRAESLIDDVMLYAILHLGSLRLFIPQIEVIGLESIHNIEFSEPVTGGMGMCHLDGIDYSLIAIDDKLQKQNNFIMEFQDCVFLNDGENRLGLVCENVDAVMREQIQIRSIPDTMRSDNSPFLALAVYQNRLGCISTTHMLHQRLLQVQQ